MFQKRAQGLSINVVIVAVIGLIILVVVIAMFTGKLGSFGKGLDAAGSCDTACSALGKKGDPIHNRAQCGDLPGEIFMPGGPGAFSDVSDGKVCCCENP